MNGRDTKPEVLLQGGTPRPLVVGGCQADIAFLEYFRAYAEFARQKQQQEFSLAMSRSIQASAQANIEKAGSAKR